MPLLRLSITDKCNFKCLYCMPKNGITQLPRSSLLSYEDLKLTLNAAYKAGIKKLKITGGEPLIRKGMQTIIDYAKHKIKFKDISITTNGVLLDKYALSLKKAGINRVTISLDSLNPEKYAYMTGSNPDTLKTVLAGISNAKKIGLTPIKINTVIIKDINDNEIIDLVKFAKENTCEIRFIELMPSTALSYIHLLSIPNDEIKIRIENVFGKLILKDFGHSSENYTIKTNPKIKIGFINPMSSPFCHNCKKLRLTSVGQLRSCLFSNTGIDLKNIISQSKSYAEKENELINIFVTSLKNKKSHPKRSLETPIILNMSQIGG